MTVKSETRVINMGCRLNAHESEVIRQNAKHAGLSNAVVVNTCAVTREAERQARQTIRKARRENPGATLIVTGCAAQLDPESYYRIDGVNMVIGNIEKMTARFLNPEIEGGIHVTDIMSIKETAGHLARGTVLRDFGSRTRAFVRIQQGCDHRCTFCVIPFARGPNRSEKPMAIVEQIRSLARSGHGEVVLTGVDISSYGEDLTGEDAMTLGKLAKHILDRVPDLKRLRLGSIDPAKLDDEIFALLAEEPRFMPHLHLSLQTASDLILKRMKRRHLVGDVSRLIDRARQARPDVVFGADLIAGFPTETETHHRETLGNIHAWGIAYLHVFPYSERPGTPAASMPPVDKTIAKKRARDLRNLGDDIRRSRLRSMLGTVVNVLVERDNRGHTEHYVEVTMNRDTPPGRVTPARIFDLVDDNLIAEGL